MELSGLMKRLDILKYGSNSHHRQIPGQRYDTYRVDQSACITGRPTDRQHTMGEGAWSDLQGFAAAAFAIAEQLSKVGWSSGCVLEELTVRRSRELCYTQSAKCARSSAG
jgi:hypothetical protein